MSNVVPTTDNGSLSGLPGGCSPAGDPNATVDQAFVTYPDVSSADRSESGSFGDYELSESSLRNSRIWLTAL